jgi:tetratricopeptide (TPR) repeat protein
MTHDSFIKISARLALLFFCLSVVWPSISVHAQSGENLKELKQKAAELVKEQKYTDALPVLEKLATAEPDNQQTHFYLGFALIAQANTMIDAAERTTLRIRARKAFLKSKELGNEDPLVDALIQSIPPDGSEGRSFSQNIKANILMTEAEALFSAGKLDDALKDYQKALELDPKIYEAALFSGDVYTQRGNFQQAEIWYQKAIAIDPNRETAYRYSATPLMKQNKYDQARDRYVEAYISEPYNRFSVTGLAQWAQVTNTEMAHPEIEMPAGITFDDNGEAQISPDAKAVLGSKDDGSFAWISYAATRISWRKEKFAKTFPNEKTYRHSLAEEADAVRSALALVANNKKVKKLNPSLANLKQLNDEGLLEANILLARPDKGLAQDYTPYLGQNRDKLRRYVVEYILAGGGKTVEKAEHKHRGEVEKQYDKAANQTKLSFPIFPITCVPPGACIFFSLETSFEGVKPRTPPDKYVFVLIIFTKTLEPFADPTLVITVDGVAINSGSMSYAGKESKDDLIGMGYGINLDGRTIAKLAQGKRVEMRIGSLRFPLGEEEINAIWDLYNQATVGQ